MRKNDNLHEYERILPYASEIFGVYHALLGWKSKRSLRRFERGFRVDRSRVHQKLFRALEPVIEVAAGGDDARGRQLVEVQRVKLGRVVARLRDHGSFLIDHLRAQIGATAGEPDWKALLSEKALQKALDQIVARELSAASVARLQSEKRTTRVLNWMLGEQVAKESRLAGYLYSLGQSGDTAAIHDLFEVKPSLWDALKPLLTARDPFELIDPHQDLDRVMVSPISVVHLFRQYFFEFETFLGPSVGHVWMSPGSEVELVEVSTRKTVVERSFESEFGSVTKAESEGTELDELSNAVRDENRTNTTFGFTTSVNQGWVGGSASASGSINLDKTQQQAREVTHKQMRQQTERLSTEIRKNYKSTFRTLTETSDTSSKRYLLKNATDQLINYEMRRKMRQVGVQVQDIGTYLCWQTYVDDPGAMLGVSKFVHLAEPPDLSHLPAPESTPSPSQETTELAIDIPFEPRTEDTTSDDMDETYENGVENDTDTNEGEPEKVRYRFKDFEDFSPIPGYVATAIAFDANGNDIRVEAYDVDTSDPGKVRFALKVVHVNFRNTSPLRITAKIVWSPSDALLSGIQTENQKRIEAFNAETSRAFKAAYLEAARERITRTCARVLCHGAGWPASLPTFVTPGSRRFTLNGMAASLGSSDRQYPFVGRRDRLGKAT